MKLCTKEDAEEVFGLYAKFIAFIDDVLKITDRLKLEELKAVMNQRIEHKLLYCWKNKDNKIVCIAEYKSVADIGRIGHVFTLEEERSKGYATNLIHDLTKKLFDEGLKPLLYTDYSYPASNKAYVNAGYEDKGILINFTCSRNK